VRVALPRDGHIFCTWLVTLTRESSVERAGALSCTKLDQLANALRLIEMSDRKFQSEATRVKVSKYDCLTRGRYYAGFGHNPRKRQNAAIEYRLLSISMN
jgi:mRNA interferase MazF